MLKMINSSSPEQNPSSRGGFQPRQQKLFEIVEDNSSIESNNHDSQLPESIQQELPDSVENDHGAHVLMDIDDGKRTIDGRPMFVKWNGYNALKLKFLIINAALRLEEREETIITGSDLAYKVILFYGDSYEDFPIEVMPNGKRAAEKVKENPQLILECLKSKINGAANRLVIAGVFEMSALNSYVFNESNFFEWKNNLKPKHIAIWDNLAKEYDFYIKRL